MKRLIMLVLLIVIALGAPALAQDISVLQVDAAQTMGSISPYVYGANYGRLSIITVDTIPLYQESGITYVRVNGGGNGDLSYLENYQLHQLITIVRLNGAEPAIHIRLLDGTPEKAAEIVQYLKEEHGIRYYSIGNEPNLYDTYSTEQHNREWRAIAEAMLAVDPDLILIGPDVSQYPPDPSQTPRDSAGRDFVREFLLANGDLVDIVSIHRYPFPRSQVNPVTTIDELRNNSREWDVIIPNLRQVIEETTGRDLPIAVTEVNSHWSKTIRGEAATGSHYNAIWMADVLGRMIRQQVFIVAYWDLESHGDRGTWGLLSNYEARPTYYTYQMYRHFGTELVFSEAPDDLVTIYSALREDGTLTLIVVNMGDDAAQRTLSLENFAVGGPAEVWLFDPEYNAEPMDAVTLADGDTLTLPGQSITLYALPPA